jgi:hypothetical protein
MVLVNCNLNTDNLINFNNEIRYSIATARADGAEIVRYTFIDGEENSLKKAERAVLRILSSMKRERLVQLIVKSLCDGRAESEYIKNKYNDVLAGYYDGILVKI